MEPGTIWGNRKKDSRPRTINPQTRESMVKELKQSQETKKQNKDNYTKQPIWQTHGIYQEPIE